MTPRLTRVSTAHELTSALGAPRTRGALLLLGGADGLSSESMTTLRAFFSLLGAWLERTGTAVVDGGTDSGVMRLIGETRSGDARSFRLVGVTPEGALRRPTSAGAPISVAPGHPEILLVPGSRFGDETDWLFAAADHLGGGTATTLVVNGGQLTLAEARQRLAAGKDVIVVAGSGRAADELAVDEALLASGRLRLMPLTVDADGLAAALGADRTGPGEPSPVEGQDGNGRGTHQ